MIHNNPWEYTEITSPGLLRYLSIACTTMCNYNCTFCSKKNKSPCHLDRDLLIRALKEAIDLGLTKVEITGGEPFLYPWFWDIADFLIKSNVSVFVVTNGSLITRQIAGQLADRKISVSVSLSTLDKEMYNHLTNTEDRMPLVLAAIKFLKEAGFTHNQYPVLGIQGIGSRETLSGLLDLMAWAKDQGCMFILNRPIPVGGMSCNDLITGKELKHLLIKGRTDTRAIRVPFSLDSPCNRLKAGCYIDSSGNVYPCPSIDILVGSIREQSLIELWNESRVLTDCRRIPDLLEGSCGQCEEKSRCYGCRAVSYAVWGTLWGPDPGCFRFKSDHRYTFNWRK